MLQVVQDLRNGDTRAIEVPQPALRPGHLLIRTHASLISSGTERMLVEFGRNDLLHKALAQPQRVKQVVDKARTDGVVATFAAVRDKLDMPLPLGYCNVGTVVDVGEGAHEFRIGDLVASNGAHAELVCVPKTLCARIPEGVAAEAAVFTVPGAIALQGIRLAAPTLGERIVVTGLGLIGLLAVQLLRAQGVSVLGIDQDSVRCELARGLGAVTIDLSSGEDLSAVDEFSLGRGVDAVLITASTRSSKPIADAAKICRQRGRIVLVGVTGLELSREDFYAKELSFQVSCSYGPGRYDASYEAGNDYPFGLVRWTAQRNFEAVLDLLHDGRMDPLGLLTHRFPIARVAEAYQTLISERRALGILLEYPRNVSEVQAPRRSIVVGQAASRPSPARGVVAVIGAGNYAVRVLVPALKKAGVKLHSIASTGGIGAAHAAHKFGFERITTDLDVIFSDPEIDTVVIATRHSTHVSLACRALETGKHVFVEKPLAIDSSGLEAIEIAYRSVATDRLPLLMVGFNRRFAPYVEEMAALLRTTATSKTVIVTVNAGALPADHWTQDPLEGGGRIVGEACHFIDLARHLVGHPIVGVSALAQRSGGRQDTPRDIATVNLSFHDGSLAAIHYLANGHPSVAKERVEVFCAGRVLQLNNFRALRAFGWQGQRNRTGWRQDKGNEACVAAFMHAVRSGGPSPIAFEELMEVSRAAVEAAQAVDR